MSEKMTNATATEVRDILEQKIPSILETHDVLRAEMNRIIDLGAGISPFTSDKARYLIGMIDRFESALAAMISELREFYN